MTARAKIKGTAPAGAAGAGGDRTCIVTGALLPRARMIRFVKGPDGAIVPDLDHRLPGRGLWVAASPEALDQAAMGRHFARAQRGPVAVPADLRRRVEAGLAARAQSLIGLARRAGAAVAGFEKTRAALKGGSVRLLITARDGAADGRAKLAALAPDCVRAGGLSAAELGTVFGRDHAVHVAVTDPGLAERIGETLARLDGVRGPAGDHDAIPGTPKVG
ncbi:MAG: RNA-binding protein [Alphaproteobacteria bacterium]|nr:RNA-binding protein [Alphaproteobacteria bacterium]